MAVTKKNLAIAAAKREAAEKAALEKAAAKRPATANVRYLVLKNGDRFRILREDGKYIHCEGTTVRQLDPRISHRESAVEPFEGKE